MKRLLPYLLLLLLCSSCAVHDEDDTPSQLVVEGWIDSGEFPIVILTHTIPISETYRPLEELTTYMEEFAKVTISDGEHTAVMVSRRDDTYFPPMVYTTTEMRGKPGKTYTLTVDCPDGSRATAVTTIPTAPAIRKFETEAVEQGDHVKKLYAYIDDDRKTNSYYKFFVAEDAGNARMLPSDLGITATSVLPEDGKFAVSRGYTNLEKDYHPYFVTGDKILVRLVRMNEDAYRFWREYEDMLSLSRNPLFPVVNNMHGNVDGALGYWFGYGAAYYPLLIR